jgi:hypothetical protein
MREFSLKDVISDIEENFLVSKSSHVNRVECEKYTLYSLRHYDNRALDTLLK